MVIRMKKEKGFLTLTLNDYALKPNCISLTSACPVSGPDELSPPALVIKPLSHPFLLLGFFRVQHYSFGSPRRVFRDYNLGYLCELDR